MNKKRKNYIIIQYDTLHKVVFKITYNSIEKYFIK